MVPNAFWVAVRILFVFIFSSGYNGQWFMSTLTNVHQFIYLFCKSFNLVCKYVY